MLSQSAFSAPFQVKRPACKTRIKKACQPNGLTGFFGKLTTLGIKPVADFPDALLPMPDWQDRKHTGSVARPVVATWQPCYPRKVREMSWKNRWRSHFSEIVRGILRSGSYRKSISPLRKSGGGKWFSFHAFCFHRNQSQCCLHRPSGLSCAPPADLQ